MGPSGDSMDAPSDWIIIFVIKYKKRLIGSKFQKFFEIIFDKIMNSIIIIKKVVHTIFNSFIEWNVSEEAF